MGKLPLWGKIRVQSLYPSNALLEGYIITLQFAVHIKSLPPVPASQRVPCHIHLPVCLWIMDPHSTVPKKNASHGNEVLLQDTTHIIQRPCYQQGSPCQDLAVNRTTQRPPDHCKETQTAVVWSCLLFIRSGQNHLARQSERGKKTRQTEEEVGRQHQWMDRPGVWNGQAWSSASPRGQWRTGKNGGNWLRNHLWCPNDPCG